MKYQIIGGILLLVIGYGAGRYVQPAKVVTKTDTVTVNHDVIHDHVTTVTVTKILPNGEKDETTTTTDNSVIDNKSSTDSSSSTVTTYSKPQWRAGALAGLNLNTTPTPVYGVEVDRRILGPVFVGAWGNNAKQAGLSLSIEF